MYVHTGSACPWLEATGTSPLNTWRERLHTTKTYIHENEFVTADVNCTRQNSSDVPSIGMGLNKRTIDPPPRTTKCGVFATTTTTFSFTLRYIQWRPHAKTLLLSTVPTCDKTWDVSASATHLSVKAGRCSR